MYKQISNIVVKENIAKGNRLHKELKYITKDFNNWEHNVRYAIAGKKRKTEVDIVTPDYIIELKYGYEYDTKKAKAEVDTLLRVKETLEIIKTPVIVLWKAKSIKDIIKFKCEDSKNVIILTGQEFCREIIGDESIYDAVSGVLLEEERKVLDKIYRILREEYETNV